MTIVFYRCTCGADNSSSTLYKCFALCSDGMGRTGTFCALLLCHERLLTEHMANVFDTIKAMRRQRPGMVENSVRK